MTAERGHIGNLRRAVEHHVVIIRRQGQDLSVQHRPRQPENRKGCAWQSGSPLQQAQLSRPALVGGFGCTGFWVVATPVDAAMFRHLPRAAPSAITTAKT